MKDSRMNEHVSEVSPRLMSLAGVEDEAGAEGHGAVQANSLSSARYGHYMDPIKQNRDLVKIYKI